MATKSYEVQSGDSLGVIAQENNTSVSELMSLNPQIKDEGSIYAGNYILIPIKEEKKKPEVEEVKKKVAEIKATTKDSKPEEVYDKSCRCQTEEMLKIKKQYQDIINHGRKYGANWAAKMLEHWMQGSGEDLIITMELLKRYDLITDAEGKIQEKILKGIKKRVDATIQDGEKIYYIAWEEGLTASIASEFFYASGSSNLVGRIKTKINKNLKTTTVSGVLEYHWADPYDWHLGLDAWIPGVGTIKDADASKYESAGCAKSFGMYSFWYQPFYAEYITDDIFYIDTETVEWGEAVEGRADVSKRGTLWEWEIHNMNAVKDGNNDYYVGLIKNGKKDSISNTEERRDREVCTRRDNRRDERRDRR